MLESNGSAVLNSHCTQRTSGLPGIQAHLFQKDKKF